MSNDDKALVPVQEAPTDHPQHDPDTVQYANGNPVQAQVVIPLTGGLGSDEWRDVYNAYLKAYAGDDGSLPPVDRVDRIAAVLYTLSGGV